MAPSLDAVKNRLAAKPAAEAAGEAPKQRKMPEKLQVDVANYLEDAARLEKESAAEEVRVPIEAVATEETVVDDNMFYSGAPFDNKIVRKQIESACESMDFADLVISGRVSQFVPIIKDKLEVEFQSLIISETVWLEKRVQKEASTEWTMRTWMGYARLALNVTSLNGRALPSYRDEKGNIDDAMFEKRMDVILRLSETVVQILLVNSRWFDDRVQNLFKNDFELLKNG